MPQIELRRHIRCLLEEEQAHVSFEASVAHFPVEMAGDIPDGWAWSAWQLVEHIRIAEADILAYCLPEPYQKIDWPDDYWPSSAAPPDENAWLDSIQKIRDGRRKLLSILDSVDVLTTVPHSNEHTYLREFLLVADHAGYHVGQIVALRRALGVWPS